jgi:hypothetical protein
MLVSVIGTIKNLDVTYLVDIQFPRSLTKVEKDVLILAISSTLKDFLQK